MSRIPSLSPDTRLFAVFGHPISHSLSPAFQNAGLQAMKVPGAYLAFDVPPENLKRSLQTLSDWKAGGVNLTIPLKEVAFDLLDELADSAAFAGSVNTVEFGENGSMKGHSTDGAGLHLALEEAFGTAFKDQKVLILGCGGAGRAAALQAAREGASQVYLANRTLSKAEAVAGEINQRLPDVETNIFSCWPPKPEEMQEADLIIQSTSLGMTAGQEVGFSSDHFREGQGLLDMIYTKEQTPIMKIAATSGVKAVNGIGMLLHQGVESLRIWTGQEPPVHVMREALIQAVRDRETIRVH